MFSNLFCDTGDLDFSRHFHTGDFLKNFFRIDNLADTYRIKNLKNALKSPEFQLSGAFFSVKIRLI